MTDLAPLWLSLKLAGTCTCLSMLVFTPLTYALSRGRFRGKLLLESFISLPLVLPPTVFGFYMLVILGSQGAIGRGFRALSGQPLIFTFSGIVAASILHGLPYVMQPLKASFEKLDRRLLEGAAVLGCSPLQTFFRVVLPNSCGGLLVAAILSFAHTMGGFGVILMVGGSIPGETRVASIAIFELVEAMHYQEARNLSLALLLLSYLILITVNLINGKSSHAA